MTQKESFGGTDILRCPSPLDCAECDETVECFADIIAALSPEQRRAIAGYLQGEDTP